MTADEPGRGPDPDDWFDEPETGDPWNARVERLARERQTQRTDADDWLTERAAAARPIARRLPRRGVLAIAASLILVVVGVLAAAGVFSGSSRRTTPPLASTRSTPATTAATTTQPFRQPTLPTTTLKPGDHGAAVSLLQHALARAGYSPGAIDASYGPATTQAVKSFQQAHGLAADGVAGMQTLAALRHALHTG